MPQAEDGVDMNDQKPRILAIDDEEGFRDMLRQYFTPRDYDIDVVAEGEDGLKAFREKEYDVVILDLKMAGLDGDEIMRKMREIDGEITAIFVSAFNDNEVTKDRLLREGAYAYLEKPLSSLKDLEALINKAAAEKKAGNTDDQDSRGG